MLHRRKVLISMLDSIGPSSSIRLQKMMFLYCLRNSPAGPYTFYPHERGAYSKTLSDDYHAMLKTGYLVFSDDKYSVGARLLPEEYALSDSESQVMALIVNRFKAADDIELVTKTYEVKPQYAIRSHIADSLPLSEVFWVRMRSAQARIEEMPHCLYTIGYEGRSIDDFMRALIAKGVKVLVDVRKNAYSMRNEYKKGYLSKVLAASGIEYVHCPEVGIDSGKRNELIHDGMRGDLFEWYKSNVLPMNTMFAEKVEGYLVKGSVALMCFEKDPVDCHRSHLATFCHGCRQDIINQGDI